MRRRTRVRFPPPPLRGLRRLCGDPSQNDEQPRTGRSGAVFLSSGTSRPYVAPGRGAHATLGLRTPDRSRSRMRRRGGLGVRGAYQGATDASTTAAEDVTRGGPPARSRTGYPCASRTAGRSCRPDSRVARRPGVAGRRSGTRTGTAVASESWADARSRRSRREGAYEPARQARAAGAGVLMSGPMGARGPAQFAQARPALLVRLSAKAPLTSDPGEKPGPGVADCGHGGRAPDADGGCPGRIRLRAAAALSAGTVRSHLRLRRPNLPWRVGFTRIRCRRGPSRRPT